MSDKCGHGKWDTQCCTQCTLTERLAQAERERDNCRASAEHNRQVAERRQAEVERQAIEICQLSEKAKGIVTPELWAQANAATVRANMLTAERDAALAKAEAAEKALARMEKYDALYSAEHADLRARIEALADEWEGQDEDGCPAAEELRALLHPVKTETALDVVDWLERNGGARGPKEQLYFDALAKLRKLLEDQGK